jgi:asparaginyl-tRNA synthetase
LHLEAPTHSLARTYTLSPSFRAEPSLTSRHLSEFYMLEGEVAFVQTLDGLMDLVEDGLRKQAERIMWGQRHSSSPAPVGLTYAQRSSRHERIRRDLEIIASTQAESETSISTSADGAAAAAAAAAETDFEARADRAPLAHLINLAARPFERISYTEAVRLCRQYADTGDVVFNKVPTWEEGLGTEHEKWLAGHFDGPVFITHYPRAVKPFYMLPSDADPSFASTYAGGRTNTHPSSAGQAGARYVEAEGEVSNGDTVACFDLVFPSIGELVGGSLREHRHDHLLSRMQELGMKEEEYQWYLDLRKYGSVPHGGWGMGFDRWVCWVTGVGNVRDVVPFPRWRGNCRY